MDGEIEIESLAVTNELPSPEQVRGMPLDEYGDFLRRATILVEEKDLKPYIPIIIDRFETDQQLPTPDIATWNQVHDAGENTTHFFWSLTHLDGEVVTPDQLDQLYKFIHSDNRRVRYHTIENAINLIRLDYRNADNNKFINLQAEFEADLVKRATSLVQSEIESAQWMVDVVWAEYPGALPDIFSRAMQRAQTIEEVRVAYNLFTNRIGTSKANSTLHQLAVSDPSFAERMPDINIALGFNRNTESDLVKLYKKINFDDYEPNAELNSYEVKLLLRELEGAQSIVDIGAGYGRHLLELKKHGKDVTGVDMVFDHVAGIKTKDETAEVLLASWRNLPFEDGHFDTGYVLGRSLLHESSREGMIEALVEIGRVTRNGIVIDLPNPDVGHYEAAREEYANAAENLGVVYYEDGSLIDSPDQQHFAERLAPDEEQFKAIAFIAGFEAKIIDRRNYTDEEGYENENLYWKLEKLGYQPSFSELHEAVVNSKTGYAPLFVSFI